MLPDNDDGCELDLKPGIVDEVSAKASEKKRMTDVGHLIGRKGLRIPLPKGNTGEP